MSTLPDLIKRGETCPYYTLLNMKIDEVKEGYARLTMNLEEKHLQFLKTVHGGAIASLADSAAACGNGRLSWFESGFRDF